LKVAKPEPRCLRRRGSILPALKDELTPRWEPRRIPSSSKKPQLKKNEGLTVRFRFAVRESANPTDPSF
jgi:hypothetical protein